MNKPFNHQSRRTFLKQTAGLSAGFAIGAETLVHAVDFDNNLSKFSLPLGVYASYEKADLLKQYGCSYIEESVGGFLIPKDGDLQYAKNLQQLKDEKFPDPLLCNSFAGTTKNIGPGRKS